MSNGRSGLMTPKAMRTAIYPLLTVIVLIVFGRSVGFGFINLDDPPFVTQNTFVNNGFTWRGLMWAFQGPHWSWHPLTWLSHMLDCQIFGIERPEDAAAFSLAGAAGHHLVNVLLHAANTMLLLYVLQNLTRRFWPSAAVALLFAVHPLRVEAVVWVAERKELLCLLFGLATIAAYAAYARRPHWGRYLTALVFYTLCLLSKPMLVTLPFVLLLLDFWPLKTLRPQRDEAAGQINPNARDSDGPSDPKAKIESSPESGPEMSPEPNPESQPQSQPQSQLASKESESAALQPNYKWIVGQKAPFLILAIGCAVMTIWAAKSWHPGAIASMEDYTIVDRLANAVVSYARYLQKMVWPQNLTLVYPLQDWPIWVIALSAAVVLLISGLAVLTVKKRPYVLVGWLWFVGTLVPAIGLVQAGDQAMADRFTYIPMIGILIALVWLAADTVKIKNSQAVLAMVVMVIAVSWSGLTWLQQGYWRSSETLFRHTLDKTEKNPFAHLMLGQALAQKGDMASALEQYQMAFILRPEDARVRSARGRALLGVGQFDLAIVDLRRAVELDPRHFESHVALGKALGARGKHSIAVRHFLIAIRLVPQFVDGYYLLALSYQRSESTEQAAEFYAQALELNPYHIGALIALARLRATSVVDSVRHGPTAVILARRACRLTQNKNAAALDVLASAYAELGQFPDAVKSAEQALAVAQATGQTELAAKIPKHIEAFKQGKRLRLKEGQFSQGDRSHSPR